MLIDHQKPLALIPSDVSKRYLILGKIGAGGSACVYRACDRRVPERLVAVKLLHQPLLEPTVRRAFERECLALERLRGTSGIMTVHGSGVSDEGLAWLVSDLYETSYRERTRSLGCIPWPEATAAGSTISHALSIAHGKGILHRDLKPGNFFIDRDGIVALGDFGSAIDTDRTLTTSVSLSLQFAAPETLKTGEYSTLSDLYSLGSSLYYLLSGRLPLQATGVAPASPPGSEHLNLDGQVEAPLLELPEAPSALIDLVHAMMSSDPRKRPQTALDVAKQLDAIVCTEGDDNHLQGPARSRIDGHRRAVQSPPENRHVDRLFDRKRIPQRSAKTILLSGLCVLSVAALFVTMQGMQSPSDSSLLTGRDPHSTRVDRGSRPSGNGLCVPSSLLCEDFEQGLASWKDESNSRIATLEAAVGGWTGKALMFEPGEIAQEGASSMTRQFIAPLAEEPIRIRARIKPVQSGQAYWWMNILQATDGLGNLYAVNFQHATPTSIRFDIFHYSSVSEKGINEPSDVDFPFDNWLCAEMVIDPFNGSDLTLHVNGRQLASLSGLRTTGTPVSWELRIGTADVSDPSAAPRILFDDILVDRANTPAC